MVSKEVLYKFRFIILILSLIAIDLFSAISGVSVFSPSNTAYVAHIGGALTGFLLMYFWKKNQFDKFRWN